MNIVNFRARNQEKNFKTWKKLFDNIIKKLYHEGCLCKNDFALLYTDIRK